MEEVLAQIETLRSLVEELRITNAKLVEQNTQQAAQVAFLEGERRNQQAQILLLNSRPDGGQPKTLIEGKGLTRPKDFTNKEEDWDNFAFKYVNWLSSIYPRVKECIEWTRNQEESITSLQPLLDLGIDNADEISRQVYVSLAQMLSDESLQILRNSGEDQGFEAWRNLVCRWNPQTIGRRRNALQA